MAAGLVAVTNVVEPVVAQAAANIPMYRLYNPTTGEHFYTADLYEATVNVAGGGWTSEGIGWWAPPTGTGSPVYRLNAKPGGGAVGHLYTLNYTEWMNAIKSGQWLDEGIGWYSNGSVAIYREFNPRTGQHNFTADWNEHNVLTTQQQWANEGIAWYGVQGASPSDQTVTNSVTAYRAVDYSTSYYVEVNSTSWACDQGKALGQRAAIMPGTQRFTVILDYASMTYVNSTWRLTQWGQTGVTLPEAGNMVYYFGACFYGAVGSDTTSVLYVALGTNSSGTTTADGGVALAKQITGIDNQFLSFSRRQVYAVGANDFEGGWASGPQAKSWHDGYMSYAGHPILFNYGSANGCPPAGTVCIGLTTDDIWYLSWHQSAYPVPEIYTVNGSQAKQWRALSAYSYNKGNGYFIFYGVLTQNGACQQYPSNCAIGSTGATNNTPDAGLAQLQGQIADLGGFIYNLATDIQWKLP